MNQEIDTIQRNKTWEFVELSNYKARDVKWYKKLNSQGEIDKHKARLVVKGFKNADLSI